MNIEILLDSLDKAPTILEDLISEIPQSVFKNKRIPEKWCIHEHTCHLYDAQKMMIDRFNIFKATKRPSFTPFLPGTNDTPDDHLIDMDLKTSLEGFRTDRKSMVALLKTFTVEDWGNEATHPEYIQYNPKLFLRHIVMHDHFHMYRIEELWLTADGYL